MSEMLGTVQAQVQDQTPTSNALYQRSNPPNTSSAPPPPNPTSPPTLNPNNTPAPYQIPTSLPIVPNTLPPLPHLHTHLYTPRPTTGKHGRQTGGSAYWGDVVL
ncbi:hypothetical protein PILCRDRAFT_4157 [Piloderma croceum F 1598]|uniref:Uncharacterized protein n=1 Tax=Piloderma croceum (strain F 1598) TaxID=765440 RepID=A0A0C3G4Y7_PILCF|nr:hypothetical protein PILCRDRAFT_4157 [Piloderma croceum F 1598]